MRCSQTKMTKKKGGGATNNLFLLHDNAPLHHTLNMKEIPCQNNVITVEHPLYSYNIAPMNFLLVYTAKNEIEGTTFCGFRRGDQKCYEEPLKKWIP